MQKTFSVIYWKCFTKFFFEISLYISHSANEVQMDTISLVLQLGDSNGKTISMACANEENFVNFASL